MMEDKNFVEIDLDEWEKFGAGGNAESFYNKKDKTKILKLAFSRERQKKKMFEEIETNQQAISLGIKTPKIIECVKYNNRYGAIYERLVNKKSIGALCKENPEKIEEYAKISAKELYKLHNIECDINDVRSKKNNLKENVCRSKEKVYKPIILRYIEEIEDKNTVLHGDATVGNLLSVNDEYYWIDLGTLMYGNPMYDIGIMYLSYTYLIKMKSVQNLFHIDDKQAIIFYEAFRKEYLKLTKIDEKYFDISVKKIASIVLYIMSTIEKFPFIIKFVVKIKLKKLIKEIENEKK